LGQAEETLIRSAPEAFFRRFTSNAIKPTGRGKRGGGWSAAKGSSCPKGTIEHGDHTELVKIAPYNPDNVYPIDHLVVHDAADVEHHLRLSPDMTAKSLGMKIEEASPAPNSRIFLYAAEKHYEVYTKLLAEVYPDSPYNDIDSREAGVHRVQGRVTFCFSADYYRALAKIAFHYYLVVNKRGFRGDESIFDAIRDFIMKGGDHKQFFDTDGAKFFSPSRELPGGGAVVSDVWAHVLAADGEREEAVVNVMLFMGPKRVPPPHHVRVAIFDSPLIVPKAQTAHVYVYHDSPDSDGFAGIVRRESVNRIR